MHILEHDPVTFLMADVELLVGNNVLTLTKCDLVKHLLGVKAQLLSQRFYISDGVGAG
jgi:uncharacterized membrane protein YuzA (DUF378 family)